MSERRQQQLRHDRLRTKAISVYLDDHRAELHGTLKMVASMDSNEKRKALEQAARKRFREEPVGVQEHYLKAVEAKAKAKGTKQVPSSGVHDGPQSSSPVECQQTPEVKRRRRSSAVQRLRGSGEKINSKTDMMSSAVQRLRGSGEKINSKTDMMPPKAITRSQPKVPVDKDGKARAALHQVLLHCKGTLQEIYGDAGAFGTLSSGLRLLDAVPVATWTGDDFAKAAAVLGVAAKLTQTPMEGKNHVRTLWTKIAGKHRERQVRNLELKVLTAWARDSLESDYLPPVVE